MATERSVPSFDDHTAQQQHGLHVALERWAAIEPEQYGGEADKRAAKLVRTMLEVQGISLPSANN